LLGETEGLALWGLESPPTYRTILTLQQFPKGDEPNPDDAEGGYLIVSYRAQD
jgi:hypothetical protein